MLKKSRFRLKPARSIQNKDFVRLSFRSFMRGENTMLRDPVIAESCGEDMDYGKLFAYCFRRFGYPNIGWDDHKELARYVLTTPHPDMFLTITPYAGDTTALTFGFWVKKEAHRAIDAYAGRFLEAWHVRAFDWREQHGLPEWMEEWMRFYTTEWCKGPVFPEPVNWRDTIRPAMTLGQPGDLYYAITKRATVFRESIYEEYEKVEAMPEYFERPADWREMDAEDPLKPFAEAAAIALPDLHRPVGIRDIAINAFGQTEFSRGYAEPASAAGYPSGDLGNAAPKEFAELHGLVLKLGKGNAKRGINQAVSLLQNK